MSEHIGIVACSAEGAALCYRTICTEGERWLGPHGHPQVSLHSHSLADYVACLDQDDWSGVAALMRDSAARLEAAGATVLICPDNTIHQALPEVTADSNLPWLHIAEVVAREATAGGYRCLGLTGTRWLVEGPVYPEKLGDAGLAWLRPEPGDRDEINRVIMEELVRGQFNPGSTQFLVEAIARLAQAGADAVVLGCTELPLVLNPGNSPLPVLDSTRLLARAALSRAAGAAL